MKKIILLLPILIMFTGCLNAAVDVAAIVEQAAYHPVYPQERTHLRVGVVPGPYGDMFMAYIEPQLALQGYTVQLVHFDDFIQPNWALAANEIDLNVFQHSHFLNNFKFENDLDLSPVAEIPTVSMGVFSNRHTALELVPAGASVALPDDATNLARGLRALEAAGEITLDPMSDRSVATEANVIRNPRELTFSRVPAAGLVAALDTHDMAVITGGFAYAGGLDIAAALYNETLGPGNMIVITVRSGDLARAFVSDILDIVHSEAFIGPITSPDSPFVGFQRPLYLLR